MKQEAADPPAPARCKNRSKDCAANIKRCSKCKKDSDKARSARRADERRAAKRLKTEGVQEEDDEPETEEEQEQEA